MEIYDTLYLVFLCMLRNGLDFHVTIYNHMHCHWYNFLIVPIKYMYEKLSWIRYIEFKLWRDFFFMLIQEN